MCISGRIRGSCVSARITCLLVLGVVATVFRASPPVSAQAPVWLGPATEILAQVPGRKVVPPPPKVQPPPKAGVPPQKSPVPMPKGPPPAAKGKTPKLPEPEDVALETRDGMTIKATYYAGTAKKETAPVILVHALEGQRGDYHSFALYLQAQGFAAIAPDLRGHGQSKLKKADGSPVALDPDKLMRPELEAMVHDVEACKKFLLEKNNAGELNIEMLAIIGAEYGGIVAVRWAAADWAARDLPAYKQGRDVKAIVLLSPLDAYKAVTMREALTFAPVQSQISMMFVAGTKDSKSTKEAKKVYDALQRHHPKLPEEPDERRKLQELYLIQPEVNLSGTKLLASSVAVRDLPVREMIAIFLERRLIDRKSEFPWQDRKSPL
jgi:pimeloyl-ACP methyl ester carboxylesterase